MKLFSQIIIYPIKRIDRFIMKYQFKEFGRNSMINEPLRIQGPENITLRDNVLINKKTWLAAIPIAGEQAAELVFDEGCVIGDFNHIWSSHSIVFEKNVLTANHVYVSDNLHSYDNVDIPIVNQPIKQLNTVVIGEGSWLGENVCVIGASIGKHCVIGANAVVTKDVPDFCIAVGSPARVIKRYDFEKQEWRKTNNDGNFIEIQ